MKDNSQNNLPETKNLILERERSVLKIWFNRVESRNALNAEMTNELVEVLDYAKDDSSLRTIVLRGKGDIFCAGGDIKDFKNTMQNTDINSVSLNKRDPETKLINKRMKNIISNKDFIFIDRSDFFCNEERCLLYSDNKLLFRDIDHITEAGAIYMGKIFEKLKIFD